MRTSSAGYKKDAVILIHFSAACIDNIACVLDAVRSAAKNFNIISVIADTAPLISDYPALKAYYKHYRQLGNAVASHFKLPLHTLLNGLTVSDLLYSFSFKELADALKSEKIMSAVPIPVGFPIEELRTLLKNHPKLSEVPAVACDWMASPQTVDTDIVKSLCDAPKNTDTEINYRELSKKNGTLTLLTPSGPKKLKSMPYHNKTSSYLYTCEDYPQLLIKSVREICADKNDYRGCYHEKLLRLMAFEGICTRLGIKNALPQYLLTLENMPCGFAMWSVDYIYLQNGEKSENMSLNKEFSQALKNLGYENTKSNRLLILENVCKASAVYELFGIFFSDIKPDNFMILKDLTVIPIDSDGWSVNGSEAWPPRIDYRRPNVEYSCPWYQNSENEYYTLSLMMYKFFMEGSTATSPDKDVPEEFSLKAIMGKNPEKGVSKLLLRCRKIWGALPEYIKRAFFECFELKHPPSAAKWLNLIRRYRAELSYDSTQALPSLNKYDKIEVKRHRVSAAERISSIFDSEIPMRDESVYILPVYQDT